MSDLVDLFAEFRKAEADRDVVHAKWYLAAAVALAASSAGDRVPDLYHFVVADLPLDQEKIVQRRIKEALLKTSVLMGIPKALQSLVPLYRCMDKDKIDAYGPRTESLGSVEATKAREERAQHHFDMLWTQDAAREHKQFLRENHPDAYLLCTKWSYEYWFSEDAILSLRETQICTTAAIMCVNSPTQALWHTRGIVRVGGTIEEARLTQEMVLRIADRFGARTGDIVAVDDIDFDGKPSI
ncbi:carboxymuconolactone decarboxylase [Fusarium pseudoanthophilum]|uniref:Carboxymuconolactone decarboxylase n=1 Tax=Fusarium pseudoanthophilum TaxID=48495 RepID=A0A8H5KEK9_9HYPO|nr:carboxymuconolactone decarboxylase [Fusarium pseudoanthophilum]